MQPITPLGQRKFRLLVKSEIVCTKIRMTRRMKGESEAKGNFHTGDKGSGILGPFRECVSLIPFYDTRLGFNLSRNASRFPFREANSCFLHTKREGR